MGPAFATPSAKEAAGARRFHGLGDRPHKSRLDGANQGLVNHGGVGWLIAMITVIIIMLSAGDDGNDFG